MTGATSGHTLRLDIRRVRGRISTEASGRPMSRQIIRELHEQYRAAIEMFLLAVENCPDHFWTRVFGDNSPFWKEAYHAVFYLRNLANGPSENKSLTPFGIDLDPRLITKAQGVVSKGAMNSFVTQTREHVDRMFSELTVAQLEGPDNYAPERYRSIHHRLLYGLRHFQHHTGKLTGYLFCNGIDYDPWR